MVVLVAVFRVVGFEIYHVADWYTWFVVDGLATGSLSGNLSSDWRNAEASQEVVLGAAKLHGFGGVSWGFHSVSQHETRLWRQACNTRFSIFSCGNLIAFPVDRSKFEKEIREYLYASLHRIHQLRPLS